jgi:hypothetical protein
MPCSGCFASRVSPLGDSLPAEQSGQGAKASVHQTVSLPHPPSCACPAEQGTRLYQNLLLTVCSSSLPCRRSSLYLYDVLHA